MRETVRIAVVCYVLGLCGCGPNETGTGATVNKPSHKRKVSDKGNHMNTDEPPQSTVHRIPCGNGGRRGRANALRLAKTNTSPHHSKLGLATGRLFCLIVARSFVDGVAAYETQESLSRFSDGVTAILDRYANAGNDNGS